MFKYILLFVISVSSIVVNAQSDYAIVVTDWVNKPESKSFEKPLLFVDFWATWCVPCIHAMPQTEYLKEEFGDDVLFVYISDENTNKVINFMHKFNKNFYSAIDNSKANYSKYHIQTIPHSILLDNNGKLIWEGQPVELKKDILQKYVDKYKNKNGDINRIVKVTHYYTEDKWLTFASDSSTIYYLEKESIPNSFTIDSNNYYISGDLNHLVSIAYDVSTNNIVSDVKTSKKYIIKCNSVDYDRFINILKEFLIDKCSLDIQAEEESVEAYILKVDSDANFLQTSTYEFEKGDNTYLADNMNITLDNSTVKEMTDILSNFSEYRFIYSGDINKRYDWKIHYKFNNLTLEQLENELNFSIIKNDTAMIEVLHISRKY